MDCPRCDKELTQSDKDFCWYCGAKLCEDCFAAFKHCGHSQAEAISENMKKIKAKDGG